MLFLLTGDVQIGKTRWLERLCSDLAAAGVCTAGVIAPGQWVPRAEGQPGGKRGFDGEGRFEKLGIDNVLLPQGTRIVFARRRDLAQAGQAFAEGTQAKAAQLAWAISDEAIAQVNNHFAMLTTMGQGDSPFAPFATKESSGETSDDGSPAAATKQENYPHSSFAFGTAGKERIDGHRPISHNGKVPVDAEMGQGGSPFAPLSGGDSASAASAGEEPTPTIEPGSFLVVDELGRLELLRGCGLTNAVALLDAGPTPTFPHALAVVRETLLDQAVNRFAPAWGTPRPIAPDDEARQLVFDAFGIR